MRDFTFPLSPPKQALVDAAEKLFAERGFEAVSVRDIGSGAKSNAAAVNYHFGSRETLLSLVMIRCATPVNEERLARLNKAERQYPGKVVPLEEILDAFVRPLLTAVRKSELSEQMFYKLAGRVFAAQGQGMPSELEEQFQVLGDRFAKAFGRALPEAASEELIWRIQFVIGGLIHLLDQQDVLSRLSKGASGTPTMELTLGRFIRFASAGLRNGQEAGEPVPVEKKKGPQTIFDF